MSTKFVGSAEGRNNVLTLNAGNSKSSSLERSSTSVTGTSVFGSVKVDIFAGGAEFKEGMRWPARR
jgi:hypothetical protein